METASRKKTIASQARSQVNASRGNFYYGLGFALLAGLLTVVGLGVLGITSLGIFSTSTAMAMIAISITMLSIVSFVTLLTMRRTLGLLDRQENVLSAQSARVNDLDAKVQAQWRADQVVRDRNQDAQLASLSTRQDASSMGSQASDDPTLFGHRPVVLIQDPFAGGQVHLVREIEGVGEHYGTLLDDLGLKNTRDLWNADARYVADALKIHPTAVDGWQCMAELLAITGIGKQYAELLVRADVSSIDELCAETAQTLLSRIHRLEEHRGNRIQGNTIGIKIVNSWIAAAQAHHGVAPSAPVRVAPSGKGV